jgi:isoleucyl-tRNA synthetase
MWPTYDEALIDDKVMGDMRLAQRLVSLGHAARNSANLKVRLPLTEIVFAKLAEELDKSMKPVRDKLAEEVSKSLQPMRDKLTEEVDKSLQPMRDKLTEEIDKSLQPMRDELSKMGRDLTRDLNRSLAQATEPLIRASQDALQQATGDLMEEIDKSLQPMRTQLTEATKPLIRASQDALQQATGDFKGVIEELGESIKEELNVKNVRVAESMEGMMAYSLNPLPQVLGKVLKGDFPKVQKALREGDPADVERWAKTLLAGENITVEVDGQRYEITPEQCEVRQSKRRTTPSRRIMATWWRSRRNPTPNSRRRGWRANLSGACRRSRKGGLQHHGPDRCYLPSQRRPAECGPGVPRLHPARDAGRRAGRRRSSQRGAQRLIQFRQRDRNHRGAPAITTRPTLKSPSPA